MNVRPLAGAIAVLGFASALPDVQPILHAQEGRLEVTVVVGTAPVDDADVSIAALGRRLRVDDGGRVSFEGLPPPGEYVLEAVSARWGRGVTSVAVLPATTSRVEMGIEAIFHLDEMVVSAGVGSTPAPKPTSLRAWSRRATSWPQVTRRWARRSPGSPE